VKIRRVLSLIVVALLFSCAPKKIEIPLTEAPPGPLLQALEQRSRSFRSLRALAGITVKRKDRKRSFETVAVLITGRERFKLEAYGPLGQSLVTVLWQGKDVFLDMNGEQRVLPPAGSGLDRVLGADVDPAELCSILSGNVPGILEGPAARMRCAPNNSCILELAHPGRLVKVYPAMGWEPGPSSLPSFEVYRNSKMIYRVRYADFETVAGYDLPKRIVIENPDRQMSLTVDYAEADVNVPLDNDLFVMPGQGAGR
jgi:outer membrane biogenesis lipoprotein LolB